MRICEKILVRDQGDVVHILGPCLPCEDVPKAEWMGSMGLAWPKVLATKSME